jgi:predicted short-subunit dehydrogenase-like oxidoreductase (DUF2520 family)
MKIVFIGAGSLAHCVAQEMQRVGMTIGQIYSRTGEHAKLLAKKLNCRWTADTDGIMPDADLYIFALKDDALPDVIRKMKSNGGLWVHTSGNMPVDIFEGYAGRYGVFYLLQTFTKKRRIWLKDVPVFLEANNPDDAKLLKNVAIALTGRAYCLDSEKRARIHLASVFAVDFVNCMYRMASRLMEEQEFEYSLLLPAMMEAAERLGECDPYSVQADPLLRLNIHSPEKHPVLPDATMQNVFRFLCRCIHEEKMNNSASEE